MDDLLRAVTLGLRKHGSGTVITWKHLLDSIEEIQELQKKEDRTYEDSLVNTTWCD